MSNIETSTTPAINAQVQVAEVAHASMWVRNHFEQLAIERETWENTTYRTSNEQLYALLQKCFQTYQAMTGTEDEASALRKGLNDYINTKGYKFNTGTHTLVKIVKCVFGADRRFARMYGGYGYLTWTDNDDIPNSYSALGYGGQAIVWSATNDKYFIVFSNNINPPEIHKMARLWLQSEN